MRRIIIQEFITLDGVMQAPGAPDEDTSENFRFGGWTAPYYAQADKEADEFMGRWMQPADLLLGRKTFEIFEAYWPSHADMWPGVNDVTKYAVSATKKTTTWNNSKILSSIEEVVELKKTDGPDLHVIGSGKLIQSLLKQDLVDQMRLMIYPITLGEGKRLFAEGTIPAAFRLDESLVASNGVIYAGYTRAGEVEVGTVGE